MSRRGRQPRFTGGSCVMCFIVACWLGAVLLVSTTTAGFYWPLLRLDTRHVVASLFTVYLFVVVCVCVFLRACVGCQGDTKTNSEEVLVAPGHSPLNGVQARNNRPTHLTHTHTRTLTPPPPAVLMEWALSCNRGNLSASALRSCSLRSTL